MFCPECGKEVKENSRFCINCGHHIESDIKEEATIKKEKYNPSPNTSKVMKQISYILFGLGFIIIVASIAWWANFWNPIVKFVGKDLSDVYECIFYSGGIKCGAVTDFSKIVYGNPYNPIVFWIGVVLSVVGGIIDYINY